jgi:hypothetical protein
VSVKLPHRIKLVLPIYSGTETSLEWYTICEYCSLMFGRIIKTDVHLSCDYWKSWVPSGAENETWSPQFQALKLVGE